jgi:hypothetical protein
MKVCVTGSTIWSAMPSTFVDSTETFPSSTPGRTEDRIGFTDRLPAITPRSKSTGGRVTVTPSGPVPSSIPAGPLIQRNASHSPKASTISDPWFGGASITTRPRFSGRFCISQTRNRMPPIEWVTKSTRAPGAHCATRAPTPAASSSSGALVEG